MGLKKPLINVALAMQVINQSFLKFIAQPDALIRFKNKVLL